MTVRRITALAALAALLAVLATLPDFTSQYGQLVAFQIVQLAALAQAWNLLAGYGGLVSLATAAFVGAGAYGTAKVSAAAGIGVLPSVLIGGAAALVFAVVVSVPMFRFRGLYFTVASLVLAEALSIFMSNYNGLGGNQGIFLSGSAPSQNEIWLLSAGAAVVASLGVAWLVRSRLGLGLKSIRDDEDVAERMGVTPFRVKLAAFAVAALVMGIVGGIQAQRTGYVEPNGAFALNWTIDTVNAVIIGGTGTIIGPLLGAAISVGLSQWLGNYPEIHLIILGALLIVIIRLAPEGLWGLACRHARRAWPRRTAGTARQETVLPPDAPLAGPRAPAPPSDAQPDYAQHAAGDAVLRASGVGKLFGGVQAVEDVRLELRSGEVLGLIGPNGAGKSTLIGLLSGAIRGDGTVEFRGENVTAIGARGRARRGMGRTHQVPRPFGRLTVLENLLVAQRYGAGAGRAAALAEARRILARCGLGDFADTPASELGLLRLKRLELARALAVKPRILFLDEIGAGLIDSELRELIALIRSLRGEVGAILIVEHMLDVIRECCDRLLVLDGGRLLTSGEPATVLADDQVGAVYLGTSGGQAAPRRERRLGGDSGDGSGALLEVKGISASHGSFLALRDVSLRVAPGEVVALLGANGAGKTTTARAISGMLPVSAGEIWLDGRRVDKLPAYQLARLGVAHCMEGRRVFADLTVEENLLLGGQSAAGASRAERARRLASVYELFPALHGRRGSWGATLSGGEQQMLAIGRALMAAPRLIIFDEISLGLAPIVTDQLYEALAAINASGTAMIIIEQNVERGLALAGRVAVLEKGRVALAGTPDDIRADERLLSLYIGEAAGAVDHPANDSQVRRNHTP